MRITSGILKGRTFTVPKIGVRPTTERTREAIFSTLQAYVPEARVLDLFAGAGGLGLEAWSRGAAHVTAVEKVSRTWKILQENFQALDLSDSESAFGASQKKRAGTSGNNLQKNFQTLEPTALGHSASRRKGDLSFQALENDKGAGSACLGGYEVVRADVYDYLKRPVGPFDLIFADPPYDEVDLPKLLDVLGDALAPEGLLVFEMHKRDSYTLPDEWTSLKEKKYGSTKVIFLERTHE